MRKTEQEANEVPDTPRLRVNKDEARRGLQVQIDKGKSFLGLQIIDTDEMEEIEREFIRWLEYNKALLGKIFTPSKITQNYSTLYLPLKDMFGVPSLNLYALRSLDEKIKHFKKTVLERIGELESINDQLELYEAEETANALPIDKSPIENIRLICKRFSLVAHQLYKRHQDRVTLEVTDEYDVQDLLHALIRLFFDDIRAEEWTPSYAGGASRMDFLLKTEQIVVETKKTRQGLREREIGDQLIIDIERYKEHPDCKTLVCFVYDPERIISNPKGLERDLSQARQNLMVQVIIV